jgi:hypothetical protein
MQLREGAINVVSFRSYFYALEELEEEVYYRLMYSIVATIVKLDLYLGRNWMFVAELMLANIR